MLSTNRLHIDGRRHTLLPATTLEANRAEVLLVQADGQERRTALSLALTGRMKPSSGTVTLGHDGSMASLRRRSAVVDAPGVNAPEQHLSVKSLTAEDLALVPLKFRDRTRPTEWLVKNGFRDILDQWVEQLAPNRLLHLQLELALANHDVELLVVDSPDRHTADSTAWLPLLQQAAAGNFGVEPNAGNPPRNLLVIGVVGQLPEGWDGPTAFVGNAMVDPADLEEPALLDVPAEPAVGESAPAEPAVGEPASAEGPPSEEPAAGDVPTEPTAAEPTAAEPAAEEPAADVEHPALDTALDPTTEKIAVPQNNSEEI